MYLQRQGAERLPRVTTDRDRFMQKLKSSPSSYLIAVLFLVAVVNFLDRQVLAIVQDDIKDELGLTDGDLGQLALIFGLVHASFALPVGRLADRWSRKFTLVLCLGVWSGITVMTGFVKSFAQLAILRVGVAVGESGVTPTSYSLIGDAIPLKRRAGAIAIVAAGAPVGLMLSLLAGGLIADSFGWRMTFVLFGVPGLLIAVLIAFTLRAPRAGQADGVEHVAKVRVTEAFTVLARQRTYGLLVLAATVQGMLTYGVIQWMPSFLRRNFDLSAGEVGLSFGPVLGIAGIVGLIGAGQIADALAHRNLRWYSWLSAGALIVSWPFFGAAILSGSYALTLVMVAIFIIAANAPIGITNALIQNVSPVPVRGMSAGLKTFCVSLIGYGIGGMMIGYLSDAFSTGTTDGLGQALLTMSVALPLSALLFWLSGVTLQQDIDNAVRLSADATDGATVAD